MLKHLSYRVLKRGVRILLCMGISVTGLAVTGLILYMQNQPDLAVWHTAYLDEEYTRQSVVRTFADYRTLEERLFRQLEEQVYAGINPAQKRQANRYYQGSLSDPGRWPVNWNRSYELRVSQPRAGVLLLHGMSDSPYSLRHIGQSLHKEGAWVIGLRLPGHGTAPSGLVRAQWQDMHAAVVLAMQHLHQQVGHRPVYIIGYSTGAALAMYYSLRALDDPTLPRAERLVMISPAIGVTGVAALAKWQARLGRLLGLDKLAWNSIQPEYDPFKYGSFAVNAGDQVYRLTLALQAELDRQDTDTLSRLPPVLAFESVVDDTVSAPELIRGLFARLPRNDNELVLFDLNRKVEIEFLLKHDPTKAVRAVLRKSVNPFTIRLLTQADPQSDNVVIYHKPAGARKLRIVKTDLTWPARVFSLSHVALPFPATDPLYGSEDAAPSPGISLGHIALRGERGVLQIPASEMLRQRWNPFYSYLHMRLRSFTGFDQPPSG